MYPDPSPTTSVDIAHENSLPVVDQAAARPCRCTPASAPTKTVGYARCGLEPADVRAAVAELHELGVDSEYIFLDQPDEDPDDGLQLALQELQAGDTLMVARLARLGRSLGRIARIADQIAALDAQLAVGGELLVGMAPERLLRMAAAAQIDMLHQGLDDVSFQRWPRLNDQRHSYHQVDVVQTVWLQQLFDAGMPRMQLGKQFGVSRATVFRIANETLSTPG